MNRAMFDELLQSVEEMDAIAAGKKKPSRKFEFPDPEVKAIREKTGLSQARFAMLIGVSKRTLENWEQGRDIRPVPRRPCCESWMPIRSMLSRPCITTESRVVPWCEV